nr:uncharacterized protein I303_04370 [Kwoniella dejecticola CBS 10117]OBR85042.1 hypothetical protein I303_04370 [Kwoniella dejecticola CBS 10117]
MDYFAYSPFWDTKSNNSVLRTQRRVENPTYGHAEEKIELNAFKSGFEYIISHAQPPDLFVIQKREVEPSGRRDRVTGCWFVLHEKIYQSPTIYDVVSARLRNASYLISKTLNTLSESHPSSNPRTTTVWRSLPPEAEAEAEAEADTNTNGEAEVANGAEVVPEDIEKPHQKQTFDWNLYHSLQTTRSSLDSLDRLSKTKTSQVNPMEELKNIEAQISSQIGVFSNPSNTNNQHQNQSQPQGRAGSGSGSITTRSVRGMTPMSINLAGLASGMSPSSAGLGQTPNLGGLGVGVPSPRISGLGGIGGGLSPAAFSARAVSIAGNSPAPLSASYTQP